MAIVVTLIVLVASAAGIGLKRDWRLASWSLVFAALAWTLAAMCELRTLETPPLEVDYARHHDLHRQAVLALALSCEAVFAAVVLAVVGWRAGRNRSALTLWLASLWAGILIALAT